MPGSWRSAFWGGVNLIVQVSSKQVDRPSVELHLAIYFLLFSFNRYGFKCSSSAAERCTDGNQGSVVPSAESFTRTNWEKSASNSQNEIADYEGIVIQADCSVPVCRIAGWIFLT